MRVDLSDGRDFQSGTERFSTANNLDQTIIEITDDLTMNMGQDHTVVLGTHLEFFKFDNLFIRENFGSYRFDSLDDLERGWAQQFDYSFSNTSNPQQSAEFNAADLAFYAGDTWNVNDTLVLTYGLRIDIPTFPDSPSFNAEAGAVFGIDTSAMPTGNILWSPRAGFNWDPNADGVQQVRGGIGIFTGRTPYVWLSNQYSNTGIEFSRISSRLSRPVNGTNFIQFVPDPDNQPTDIGFASTNEVDVTDPDFKFPTTTRITLGYDRQLPWQNMTFTTELIYSQIVQDAVWQNLNVVDTGDDFFDGRPLFGRNDSAFRDVINMTNTQEGRQWNLLLKAQKRYSNN